MLKLKTTFIITLITFFIFLFILIGCKKEPSYQTVIRNNPNGTVEQWKVINSGVIWYDDGSILFRPVNLSHDIRITGCLTVFSTKIVIDQITEEKVKKSDEKD